MPENRPLVSIIMAVFNADQFISGGIESVIDQSYEYWELLVVNDGSTDRSGEIAQSYRDARIRYFYQANKGVSAARNLGLRNMKGDYFCFLDADDLLTTNSLSSRLEIFQSSQEVEFVDGRVNVFDSRSGETVREYLPCFEGNPFNELLSISEKCFFGPTWMIKRLENKSYCFLEGLTHGEDLLFYLSISRSGHYQSTSSLIYLYRKGHVSAMTNLKKLEKGYFRLYSEISSWQSVSSERSRWFHKRIKSIMFKSYLVSGNIFNALKVVFR